MSYFEITEDNIIEAVELNSGIEISYYIADQILGRIDHQIIQDTVELALDSPDNKKEALMDAIWTEIELHFDIEDLE